MGMVKLRPPCGSETPERTGMKLVNIRHGYDHTRTSTWRGDNVGGLG